MQSTIPLRVASTASSLAGRRISVCIAKVNGKHEMYLVDTINDRWDGLMIAIGRALGFDTILFMGSVNTCTRSLNSAQSKAEAAVCTKSEILDLRIPEHDSTFRNWIEAWHTFGLAYKWPPNGCKRFRPETIARAWVEDVQRRGTLSLRDPLQMGEDALARPCRFDLLQPTVALACIDHVSWLSREHRRV